jgi:hypothetical protein
MNRVRFLLKRGILIVSATLLGACYGFSGGGGFPSDIRTIYIEPFDNQTVQVELDQQLFRKLTDRVPRALGARPGSETNADAVIRGRILRYDDVSQNYRPGSAGNVDVLTFQVSITVSVEIVDRKRNVVLWDSQGLVGRGDYRGDSQKDTDGREIALNHIIQQIIDGAQSQW